MEAHRSYERFEQGHNAGGGEDLVGPHYARHAALAVAVMAAFLALATFFSNEALKEVVTGETHRADISAQLENNRLKIDVAGGDSTLLRVLAVGTQREQLAAEAAAFHERRIVRQLQPTDAHLQEEISEREHEVDHANSQHVAYELAEVALEVGIVLASVSIIVRRRWLLGAGGAIGSAGVVLLAIGLIFV